MPEITDPWAGALSGALGAMPQPVEMLKLFATQADMARSDRQEARERRTLQMQEEEMQAKREKLQTERDNTRFAGETLADLSGVRSLRSQIEALPAEQRGKAYYDALVGASGDERKAHWLKLLPPKYNPKHLDAVEANLANLTEFYGGPKIKIPEKKWKTETVGGKVIAINESDPSEQQPLGAAPGVASEWQVYTDRNGVVHRLNKLTGADEVMPDLEGRTQDDLTALIEGIKGNLSGAPSKDASTPANAQPKITGGAGYQYRIK